MGAYDRPIAITIDQSLIWKMQACLDALGPSAEAAVRRALNRSITGVGTDAAKRIPETFNVKANVVRKSFTVYRAGSGKGGGLSSGIKASAVSRGKKIPLIQFGARPKTNTRKSIPQKGISVEVVKGDRRVLEGTFIGANTQGRLMVYSRVKPWKHKQYPIRAYYSYSVPGVIRADISLQASLEEGAVKRLNTNFDHEVNRILQKMGAR